MSHILLIAGTYQPHHCGVAHYTQHLRRQLELQGIETTVFTTHAAAQASAESDVLGVVNSWAGHDLFSLVQAIHRSSADIVHIQHAAGTYGFERAIFLLPLLLRLTGWQKPIATTIHEYGWWEWQPKWVPALPLEWLKTWGQDHQWWDREDGFLLTGSDAIITTNRSATQVIQSRLPELTNLTEIPIGANVSVVACDRAQARHALRQHCGWDQDTTVIAFFGFLHPVKGLETLLPAFQAVVMRHPEARLLLLGGVESLALPQEQATRYWQQLEAKIAELHLQDQVHMTGYVDDAIASQYLTGADIGVLPFNHGLTLKSGSLLALMAHALPVVATRATPPDPGLEESPVQFFTPRQGDELILQLDQLLQNPALYEQLGQAGKAFVQTFDWTAIATRHQQIYQQLLSRSIQPHPEKTPSIARMSQTRKNLEVTNYLDSNSIHQK
jgi:glycosyltransferase involved in cell wall biosynthesis